MMETKYNTNYQNYELYENKNYAKYLHLNSFFRTLIFSKFLVYFSEQFSTNIYDLSHRFLQIDGFYLFDSENRIFYLNIKIMVIYLFYLFILL